MSSEPTTSSVPPFWLSEPCPSWCDGLHGDSDFEEDRRHQSRWGKRVRLSTMEPTRIELRTNSGGLHFSPCVVHVRIDQGYREIEPRVHIEEDSLRGLFSLTLAEAKRLAKALTKAVEVAGG